MRILLVEDDESIIEVVTAILDAQGYIVDTAIEGDAGWDLAEAFPYDLILLDIVLPKLDGISFCRKLRERKNQALVMLLTARDTVTDKLIGLEAGADDYVVKPFNVQELAARIRALLRRGNPITESILTCGNLHLDPTACEVTYNGQLLRFSRKEYLLLELFLRHQHRVFSRSAIVDQIWSFNEDPPNEDTVKSHIKSIRRKLDAAGAGDLIETLYGQGYRINPSYLAQQPVNPAAQKQEVQKQEAQKQEALNSSVQQTWQRSRGLNLERVGLLEQVIQSLRTGDCPAVLQQQGLQNAHKLAGSLGTFGLEAGSRAAQQLEVLLAQTDLSPAAQQQRAAQTLPLVNALKTALTESGQLAAELGAAQALNPVVGKLPSEKLQLPLDPPNPLLLIISPAHLDTKTALALEPEAEATPLRFLEAKSYHEALSYLEQSPDLILLEVAAWSSAANFLRQLQPVGLPIALLIAQISTQERLAAMQAGVNLFLSPTMPAQARLAALVQLWQSVQPLPSVRFKVLLVDDDPVIASLVTNCLKLEGIQVTSLQDPLQFWPLLDQVQPDLLILDVKMPGMSGTELCQIVRCDGQWRWLPIVFLTAQTDLQTQHQIFAAGADDLLFKPLESAELVVRILNRLRRTSFTQKLSSAVARLA